MTRIQLCGIYHWNITQDIASTNRGSLDDRHSGCQEAGREALRALSAPCQRRYIRNASGEHSCAFGSRISQKSCWDFLRILLGEAFQLLAARRGPAELGALTGDGPE